MRHDRLVDVEEEARQELLHAHLAHRLRQRRRADQVEEQQHALLAPRAAIASEHDAEQRPSTNHPDQLIDHRDRD
ncbi:hypothetical protein [Bradyrhizobium sp. JR3.5]